MSRESDLVDRLLAAQQAERDRIGSALHDGASQTLTAAGLRLRALEELAEAAPIRAELVGIRTLVEQSMAELQAVAARVHPPGPAPRRR